MRITHKQAREMGIAVEKQPRPKLPPIDHERNEETARTIFRECCRAWGIPEPIFEYRFDESREWRFDYLFEGFLAVEREGGVYGKGGACPTCGRKAGGAHSSVSGILRDIEKYNAAALQGFVVLRFLPKQFESGEAFKIIKHALMTVELFEETP